MYTLYLEARGARTESILRLDSLLCQALASLDEEAQRIAMSLVDFQARAAGLPRASKSPCFLNYGIDPRPYVCQFPEINEDALTQK